MNQLLEEIRACTFCDELPLGPRPIVQASEQSRILIIGQAPGQKVHQSGIPWMDASGRNLRRWMKVTEEQFYDPNLFALVPMGFCYPGKGTSGDMPPRKECAPKWHALILNSLSNFRLTLLIGMYAQHYYLPTSAGQTLTSTVQNYQRCLPDYFPLPHPSPRNIRWQKQNPWFEIDLLPKLQKYVQDALH